MKYSNIFFLFLVPFSVHAGDFSIGPRIYTQKGRFNVQEFFVYSKYNRATNALFSTDFGYGFTENTGIQVNLPILITTLDGKKTKGFGDILALGQWHFYVQPNNVGILLFGGKLPTATTDKTIHFRGRGAFAFIADIGFIHLSDYWYAQARTSLGLTTKHKNIKTGVEGRWSLSGGHRWHKKDFSFFMILTLAGFHRDSIKINDIVVPGTSGDQIFVLPEVFFQKADLSGGLGIGVPIMQNSDNQPRIKWLLGAILEKRF